MSVIHVKPYPEHRYMVFAWDRAYVIKDNFPGRDALLVPFRHKDDDWEVSPSDDTQWRFRTPMVGGKFKQVGTWRIERCPSAKSGWAFFYSRESKE